MTCHSARSASCSCVTRTTTCGNSFSATLASPRCSKPESTMIENINHINVIVRSLARARPFFEGFLGLTPHSSLAGAYVVGDGEPLVIALEFPAAKDPIPDDRHQFGRAIV